MHIPRGRSQTTLTTFCPFLTTYLVYLPVVDICLWRNFFILKRENLHTVDISRTTYLPRLVNVVCERSLRHILYRVLNLDLILLPKYRLKHREISEDYLHLKLKNKAVWEKKLKKLNWQRLKKVKLFKNRNHQKVPILNIVLLIQYYSESIIFS